MRRVYVKAPQLSSRVDLDRRQKTLGSVTDARPAWVRYRQSVGSRDVISVLKEAAGIRARCFYCSDSRATDIDHFIPMSVDYGKTFRWKNFIWVCTPCNRCKGNRFPRDAATGSDLLIDPTKEDPWAYLIMDTDTGWLAPRYRLGNYDPKGNATLEILEPINHESATEGRMRIITRLRDAVSAVPGDGSSRKAIDDNLRKLLGEVQQDDYGVSAWFAIWDGKDEDEFRDLSVRNAIAWRRFVRSSINSRYGRAQRLRPHRPFSLCLERDTFQTAYKAYTAAIQRSARACGRCALRFRLGPPSCLHVRARSAPPPCSRPHPPNKQRARSGTLHLYSASKQPGGGTNPETHWGKTRNPPGPEKHGPVPGFPPDPQSCLPKHDRPAAPMTEESAKAQREPAVRNDRGRCRARRYPPPGGWRKAQPRQPVPASSPSP
jgi:5-methylcytosine-specific restriction endonuclease McrA